MPGLTVNAAKCPIWPRDLPLVLLINLLFEKVYYPELIKGVGLVAVLLINLLFEVPPRRRLLLRHPETLTSRGNRCLENGTTYQTRAADRIRVISPPRPVESVPYGRHVTYRGPVCGSVPFFSFCAKTERSIVCDTHQFLCSELRSCIFTKFDPIKAQQVGPRGPHLPPIENFYSTMENRRRARLPARPRVISNLKVGKWRRSSVKLLLALE